MTNIPCTTIPRVELERGIGLLTLLTRCGLTKSNSEARRLVEQGGVYINNVRATDTKMTITLEHTIQIDHALASILTDTYECRNSPTST